MLGIYIYIYIQSKTLTNYLHPPTSTHSSLYPTPTPIHTNTYTHPHPHILSPECSTEKHSEKDSWQTRVVDHLHDEVRQKLVGGLDLVVGERIAALVSVVGVHREPAQTGEGVDQNDGWHIQQGCPSGTAEEAVSTAIICLLFCLLLCSFLAGILLLLILFIICNLDLTTVTCPFGMHFCA